MNFSNRKEKNSTGNGKMPRSGKSAVARCSRRRLREQTRQIGPDHPRCPNLGRFRRGRPKSCSTFCARATPKSPDTGTTTRSMTEAPENLRDYLPEYDRWNVGFRNRFPKGAIRFANRPATEKLAEYVKNHALDPSKNRSRAGAGSIQRRAVRTRTTLLLLRERFRSSKPGAMRIPAPFSRRGADCRFAGSRGPNVVDEEVNSPRETDRQHSPKRAAPHRRCPRPIRRVTRPNRRIRSASGANP